MIEALFRLIPGWPWLIAGAAAISFAGGVYVGIKWEDAAAWQARAELAETLQDVAEQKAADAEAARIDAEVQASKAARIAAASARDAQVRAVEVRKLRAQHEAIIRRFQEEDSEPEPPAEPTAPKSVCTPGCRKLSPRDVDDLLRIQIPQGAPDAGNPDPAAPERGDPPVPRPRRQP